jgi:hypothetical protein
MRRGIDDAGGRVGVEKERLRFRLLVGGKFDVLPANFRDGVTFDPCRESRSACNRRSLSSCGGRLDGLLQLQTPGAV